MFILSEVLNFERPNSLSIRPYYQLITCFRILFNQPVVWKCAGTRIQNLKLDLHVRGTAVIKHLNDVRRGYIPSGRLHDILSQSFIM